MKIDRIAITDEWLGTRIIPGGDNFHLEVIRDQHKLLCAWRDEREKPSKDLLDDIAVYEFIINHENAPEAARQYAETIEKQRRKHGLGVSKRKVASMLGWSVIYKGAP